MRFKVGDKVVFNGKNDEIKAKSTSYPSKKITYKLKSGAEVDCSQLSNLKTKKKIKSLKTVGEEKKIW